MTTVSVVIPSYNRGHCVADSVASALAQTVRPLEVIVVDDGSTDDTKTVCARFTAPVRCIHKSNGGVSSARNVGLAAARGDWIALLDADDLWPPEKLEVQLAALAACPDALWSTTNHRTTDLAGRLLPGPQGFARDFPTFNDAGLPPDEFFARTLRRVEIEAAGSRHTIFTGDVYRLLFDGNIVFPSCAMIRRDVAARAGPWDESFRVANDTEWFHRVAAVAPVAIVMTPLMTWRRGQANTLVQGNNTTLLVRNAVRSIDQALTLRGEPDDALRRGHAAARRRLLLRLAYGELTVYNGRGARAALGEAVASGAPRTLRTATIWGASWLPSGVLRALHRLKVVARSVARRGDAGKSAAGAFLTATVLHVIETWGVGGAETVCVDVASGIDRSRFRSIGAVQREGWVYETMRARGLEPVVVRPGKHMRDLTYLWGLVRVCRRERVRLLQSHLVTSSLYTCVVGRLLSIPVVSTFHGVIDFDPRRRLARVEARTISRLAARLVFVSEGLRKEFLATYRARADRTVVIHNGIDADAFRPAPDRALRQRLGIPEAAIVVAAVGNIRTAKAYDELLRVADRLRDAQPPMHFVIAGWERQPLYDQLLQLRQELRLEDRVSFLGYVDDPRTVFGSADIYLSTSSTEGFSLTTVQAMASELPVVVTRSGGPEEIVTDRVDGLLFPVGATSEIAGALAALATNVAERRRLGEAGRQTVLRRFTTDRMVARYQQVYDELVD